MRYFFWGVYALFALSRAAAFFLKQVVLVAELVSDAICLQFFVAKSCTTYKQGRRHSSVQPRGCPLVLTHLGECR